MRIGTDLFFSGNIRFFAALAVLFFGIFGGSRAFGKQERPGADIVPHRVFFINNRKESFFQSNFYMGKTGGLFVHQPVSHADFCYDVTRLCRVFFNFAA